jgi:hypothetical protein
MDSRKEPGEGDHLQEAAKCQAATKYQRNRQQLQGQHAVDYYSKTKMAAKMIPIFRLETKVTMPRDGG